MRATAIDLRSHRELLEKTAVITISMEATDSIVVVLRSKYMKLNVILFQ